MRSARDAVPAARKVSQTGAELAWRSQEKKVDLASAERYEFISAQGHEKVGLKNDDNISFSGL